MVELVTADLVLFLVFIPLNLILIGTIGGIY